jgi:putative addiction module component (TIGR02574 family)
MTAIAEHVLKDALDLSPVERAELIERLFQSFDRSQDRRVDAAWAAEIESRIDAYDNGKIKASPAEEVFARINRR